MSIDASSSGHSDPSEVVASGSMPDESDLISIVTLTMRTGTSIQVDVDGAVLAQMAADFQVSVDQSPRPSPFARNGAPPMPLIGRYTQSDGTPLVVRWDAVEVMY